MCAFSTPDPPPPVKLPDDNDPAVKDAERKERLRRALARGRESTILSGPGGATGDASVARKKLLGQ